MNHSKSARAFRPSGGMSIVELLISTAVILVLASVLFPAIAAGREAGRQTEPRSRQIALAAIAYGADYNDRLPLMLNGDLKDLVNVHDGHLTPFGNERTDGWPLLLLPYLKDRTLYIDPQRGDALGVWSGPPLASGDPGYNPLRNTYRSQSRFPMYGINYVFLAPLRVRTSKMTDPRPTGYMAGESRTFTQATEPAATVFFLESKRYDLDSERGHFGITAPGMWANLSADYLEYVLLWGGTDCSGDWCGQDVSSEPGLQKGTNAAYFNAEGKANVAFLDGHMAALTDADLTVGTDYLTASPNDGPAAGTRGGGAVITDKRVYLWNLDDYFYEPTP